MIFEYEKFDREKVVVLYSGSNHYNYYLNKLEWHNNGYYTNGRYNTKSFEADSLEEAKKKIEYIFLEYAL